GGCGAPALKPPRGTTAGEAASARGVSSPPPPLGPACGRSDPRGPACRTRFAAPWCLPAMNERLFSESSRSGRQWQSKDLAPSPEPLPEASEERFEDLVRGDLDVGAIGGFLGAHEAHGIEPVVMERPEGDGRREAEDGVALERLQGLYEAVPREIAAGAPQALHDQDHVRGPGEGRRLSPLELRLVPHQDVEDGARL